MDKTTMFIIVVAVFLGGLILGVILGNIEGRKLMKQEVINRGLMVQCLGKSGYYWGCEGED